MNSSCPFISKCQFHYPHPPTRSSRPLVWYFQFHFPHPQREVLVLSSDIFSLTPPYPQWEVLVLSSDIFSFISPTPQREVLVLSSGIVSFTTPTPNEKFSPSHICNNQFQPPTWHEVLMRTWELLVRGWPKTFLIKWACLLTSTSPLSLWHILIFSVSLPPPQREVLVLSSGIISFNPHPWPEVLTRTWELLVGGWPKTFLIKWACLLTSSSPLSLASFIIWA